MSDNIEFGLPGTFGIVLPDRATPNGLEVALTNSEMAKLANVKNYRSMSRAALLLALATEPLMARVRSAVKINPFRVGIYCATDPSAIDCTLARRVAAGGDGFVDRYRRLVPPNLYLRSLTNLAGNNLSIISGSMGPTVSFNHSNFGVRHALFQSQIDIETGVIDLAVVGGAFSLEDELLRSKYASEISDGSLLAEGAAAIILDSGSVVSAINSFNDKTKLAGGRFFGIADPLVKFVNSIARMERRGVENQN